MTFTGTIANINLRLNGAIFTPTSTFTGAATLQIVTSDQGSTGTGGTLHRHQRHHDQRQLARHLHANQDNRRTLAGWLQHVLGRSHRTYTSRAAARTSGVLQTIPVPSTGTCPATAPDREVSSSNQSGGNNNNAKAGVMLRETTATGSKQAMMDLMQTAGTDSCSRHRGSDAGYIRRGRLRRRPVLDPDHPGRQRDHGEYSPDGVTWTIEGPPRPSR